MAGRTLPQLCVLEETLGTVEQTEAVVHKVVLLTACTQHKLEGRKVCEKNEVHTSLERDREHYSTLQKNTTQSEN